MDANTRNGFRLTAAAAAQLIANFGEWVEVGDSVKMKASSLYGIVAMRHGGRTWKHPRELRSHNEVFRPLWEAERRRRRDAEEE